MKHSVKRLNEIREHAIRYARKRRYFQAEDFGSYCVVRQLEAKKKIEITYRIFCDYFRIELGDNRSGSGKAREEASITRFIPRKLFDEKEHLLIEEFESQPLRPEYIEPTNDPELVSYPAPAPSDFDRWRGGSLPSTTYLSIWCPKSPIAQ